MKILFCSLNPVTQELGAPRALLGVAGGMAPLGWEWQIIGPHEVSSQKPSVTPTRLQYSNDLREYLRRHAGGFDVVEYDYSCLPFPRSEFPGKTLFVARCVLLEHHLLTVRTPKVILCKQKLKRWLTGEKWRSQAHFKQTIYRADVTMANADIINVANVDDKALLVKRGIGPDKISVIPNGLTHEELHTLATVNTTPQHAPRICFLGTFDHRKGGADLPKLFSALLESVPNCQLRLLGTAGLHQTAERVRSFFSSPMQGCD